jgi:SAM-dependent methyltransferase
MFPHFAPPDFLERPCRLLVAGCGTGQQAVAAAHRFHHASILAVDLSAESLAYARRMASGFPGADSIEFRRADLLTLDLADESFDIVLCTGVLHHMADPEAGWARLGSWVRPGGALKIGLYSRSARRELAAARAELAAGSDGAREDDVCAARRRLAEGPHAPCLARFLDFYSRVGCRDLLLHVREQCYSLPEIADMAERLGLRFLGFELPREKLGDLYASLYPEDSQRTDLSKWAALESTWPDAFPDMYQMWFQVGEGADVQ